MAKTGWGWILELYHLAPWKAGRDKEYRRDYMRSRLGAEKAHRDWQKIREKEGPKNPSNSAST